MLVKVGLGTAVESVNVANWPEATAMPGNQLGVLTGAISQYAEVLQQLNSKDFATQATLAALLGKDFATQTTLADILALFASVRDTPDNAIQIVPAKRIGEVFGRTPVFFTREGITAGAVSLFNMRTYAPIVSIPVGQQLQVTELSFTAGTEDTSGGYARIRNGAGGPALRTYHIPGVVALTRATIVIQASLPDQPLHFTALPYFAPSSPNPLTGLAISGIGYLEPIPA